MKIAFILLFVSFLQVSAKSYGQNISINVKNASLEEVFNLLRQQSGYNFLYDPDILDKTEKITISVKQSSLKDVLDRCVQDQPVTYIISDKNVVIKKKATPGAIITPPPTQVTGRVTDGQNRPISGVTVRVKNTQIATATNDDGSFKISIANPNAAVLVFSFLGYEPKEVPATSNTLVINVILKEQETNLNQIVVVGYGTQKKSDLTGAISSMKAEDIQKSKAVSFMEAMQGRMAGIQITSSSGEPGSSVNMTIRGANSFNSGTQPLYVIDGVQIDINNGEVAGSSYGNTSLANPLASINPADIASIEVLKDASATAIFGSRGANGVVIVTTKSGKPNTSVLELNVYGGKSAATKKFHMIGAQDYAAYRFGVTPQDPAWGTDTNGDGINDVVKDVSGLPQYNWQDLTLRNALTQNYNVNYSGGNDKTTFSTSLGYLNQEGLIIYNKYERYNLTFKINHNATKRLKIGTTVNASYILSTGPVGNGSDGPRGSYGPIQYMLVYKPVNVPGEGLNNLDPDNSGIGSPVDFMKFASKKTPATRILTDLFADYRIINGLNLRVTGGGVLTNSNDKEWYPSTTSWGFAQNGMAILSQNSTNNWYQTSTLNYSKRINKVHNVTALAGFEMNSYISESFNMRSEGFDIQSINGADNINTAKLQTQAPNTTKYKYNRISQFGRLNYSFNDRYFLTATLRRDGSSKFGTNYKYALFPSGALAWTASEEPFLKKVNLISNLKVRASFGITGNDRIPPYQALARTYSTFYSSSTGTATLGLSPLSPANSNLRWETTTQYDGGIDLELMKGRIALTADVYLKQTKDLLVEADIASQGGFLKQWQNIGRVDNRGLELALSTINIKGKFNWSSNFNISFNRNKVVSLGDVSYLPVIVSGGVITNVGRLIVGQPIGTGYGYTFDGIYQLTDFNKQTNGTYTLKPGVIKLAARAAQPGDFKYKDLSGDGAVDNTNDYSIISKSDPKFYGGFSNTFSYRAFDLSVLLQGNYGNQILNTGKLRLEAGSGTYASITQEYWDDRWTPTNPSNAHAAVTAAGKTDISSYYVEDGSYLRLKNVTFGYGLPANLTKRIGMSQCRFYITGENLWTWTNYSGFDPEIASYSPLLSGLDNISYPRSRTFTLGITAKF